MQVEKAMRTFWEVSTQNLEAGSHQLLVQYPLCSTEFCWELN